MSKKDVSDAPLEIAISGGGICGLATAIALRQYGHLVTVYEARPKIEAIGYGIQMGPNLTRLLFRLGLQPYLAECAVRTTYMMLRRWENGEPVGIVRTGELNDRFGSPYMLVNRGDLSDALSRRALDMGASFEFDAKVVDYDTERPSMTLASGEVVEADLIVAADGIRSTARSKLDDTQEGKSETIDFDAYRIAVDIERIKCIPDLRWVIETPHQEVWIGPGQHVFAYPMCGDKILNLVSISPRASFEESANYVSDMKSHLAGWDPTLHKLIDLGENAGKWPVCCVDHAPRMAASSGKFVVIGDAAHDMTPYIAQGAAMSVEDAVLLGRLIGATTDRSQLGSALKSFEVMRLPRTSVIRAQSMRNRDLWHFDDGERQRERDAVMKRGLEGDPVPDNPCIFGNHVGQRWLYEYDVEKELLSQEVKPLCRM